MANRIEGITEKLNACAKKEFLEKGFSAASLRTIADDAGTTPRSVYTRYGDKEGLFASQVQSVADEFKRLITNKQDAYHSKPVEEQRQLFHDTQQKNEYEEYTNIILDYIYDNFDVFKLLICASEGTKFASYIEELAQLDADYTTLFIETTDNEIFASKHVSPTLLHMLSSAYMHGFFEIVRHDMPKHEAILYVSQLRRFYECGWDDLFNFPT